MSTIYHAHYEFFARTNTRKIQYSTKKVAEMVEGMGLKLEMLSDTPNGILRKVCFSGTREEIVEIRNEFGRKFRILAGGKVSTVFKIDS